MDFHEEFNNDTIAPQPFDSAYVSGGDLVVFGSSLPTALEPQADLATVGRMADNIDDPVLYWIDPVILQADKGNKEPFPQHSHVAAITLSRSLQDVDQGPGGGGGKKKCAECRDAKTICFPNLESPNDCLNCTRKGIKCSGMTRPAGTRKRKAEQPSTRQSIEKNAGSQDIIRGPHKEMVEMRGMIAKIYGLLLAGTALAEGDIEGVDPMNYIPPPIPDTILKTLTVSGISVDIAYPIMESLERDFKSVPYPITGLRACLLPYPSSRDWTIVQWKEGMADVTAVYKVEAIPTEPCGSLIVKGIGPVWQQDGRRFSKSFIEWTVADINDIKDMLPPIQNMLGILHGPEVVQNQSRETYTELERFFCSTRLSQLLRLERFEKEFEVVRSHISSISKEEVVRGRDAQRKMLTGSLEVDI